MLQHILFIIIWIYLTFILGNYLRSSQGTWETSWGWLNSNEPMKTASEEFWRRAFLCPTNKKLSKEEHGSCSKKLSNDQGYSCQPVHKRANSPWHLCELFTFLWEHCMCECCMCIEILQTWWGLELCQHMASALQGCQKLLPTLRINATGQHFGRRSVQVGSSPGVQQCPASFELCCYGMLRAAGPPRSPMCRSATQWFPTGFPQIDEPGKCWVSMTHSILQWMSIWCPYDAPSRLPLGFVPAHWLAHGVWATLGLGPDVASCLQPLQPLQLLHSIRTSKKPCHAFRGASLKRDWWDLKKQVNHVPEKWWKMDIIHRHSSTFKHFQTITRMFCRVPRVPRVRLRVLRVPWGRLA